MIDLSQVPAGAHYQIQRGRGPTNQKYVIVDLTLQDKIVGPYRTWARAEYARQVMQAEADRLAAASK